MATVRDVAAFFCTTYPFPHELSKARLTKMVYLADWRSAIERGEQITSIRWVFNHYGPYVRDVEEAAAEDPSFEIVEGSNFFGGRKETIRMVDDDATWPSIDSTDVAVLDHVIAVTSPLYWNDFIKLIYSTYPVVTQPRYEILDLVALAEEYKNLGEAELGKTRLAAV